MKQSSNKNRTGGRYPHFNNNRRNNLNMPTKNTVFDSSGPCGRLRGTAVQLAEKYQTAAKDARHNDTILGEICLQYADHYQRLYAMACTNDKPAQAPADPQPAPVIETVEPASNTVSEQPSVQSDKTDVNSLPTHLSFMTAELPPVEDAGKPAKPIRRPRKPKSSSETNTPSTQEAI